MLPDIDPPTSTQTDSGEAGHFAPSAPTGEAAAESDARAGRWRRLARLVAMDVGPLRRHRDFRLLYTSRAVSFFGSMITYVAITLFGLAPALPLALLALAAAGGADMMSGLFRSRIWNGTIPDALRGRLVGIELLSYASGPALGNVESGVVATLAGVRQSVVSGGVLCVVGVALLAVALPRFRRYDDRLHDVP